MAMEYRVVGESSLKASALGLGCRRLGRKDMTAGACTSLVRTALDLGMNFFDTADVYGDGQSEERLGDALRGIPRDSYILATKGGTERLGPGAERQNATPPFLRKSLEASLRRLKTDCVDLYQLHNPDPAVPMSYTAEAFTRFMDEGKVRYAGVSNMDRQELEEWLGLCPNTVSVQLPYSLLDLRRAEAVFAGSDRAKVSLIPWAPLFMGFITDPPPPEADRRTGVYAMLADEFVERAREVCGLIHEMAVDLGTTPSALALSYVIAHSGVATVPAGTTDPVHLRENIRALEVRLTPGDLARLEEAAETVPPPEVLTTFDAVEVLDNGRIVVLPLGIKIRVPSHMGTGARPGDRVEIDLWDGRFRRFVKS